MSAGFINISETMYPTDMLILTSERFYLVNENTTNLQFVCTH